VAAAWPENGLGLGKAKASTPPSNLPEGGLSGGCWLAAPVALPLVAAQLPTVRSRAASLHQPGEAGA